MKNFHFLKIMLMFSLLPYSTGILKAQNNYATLGIAYCHSAAPNLWSTYNSTTNGGSESYERVKGNGSFGRGIQISGGIGRRLSEHISAELGFAYLYGLRQKSKSEYSSGSGSSAFTSTYEDVMFGRMLRCMPALKFQIGEGKTRPYIKAGAVVGFASKLISESKGNSGSFGTSYSSESKWEMSGGCSIGYTGALGLQFQINENFGFFTEINMITQSWAPKKSKTTKSVSNGKDMLPEMDTNDKETEYVDKYSDTDNNDKNAPRKEMKYFLPFSSIGLQFGFVFNL